MRVVASELHVRYVDVQTARRKVHEAAQRGKEVAVGPETVRLGARLEKVCGCGLAELAEAANEWPT